MEEFKQIDIHEAKNLIDQGDLNIIDLRDPESYEDSHIENAVFVDQESIEDFIATADKKKPLVCYCYKGFGSQGASEYFKEQGFESVYSIMGGFEAWSSENSTTTK